MTPTRARKTIDAFFTQIYSSPNTPWSDFAAGHLDGGIEWHMRRAS